MNTNVQSDFQKSLNFIKKRYKNALEILLNLKTKIQETLMYYFI